MSDSKNRIQKLLAEVEQNRKDARLTVRSKSTVAARLGKRIGLGLVFTFLVCVILPPFRIPVQGVTSSGFFFRFKPDSALPVPEFHDAIDIAVPRGTPVHPIARGRVEATGFDASAGNWVRVSHPLGIRSFYAHLDAIHVKTGDLILLAGFKRLGVSGNTGRSTGPHLHLGIKWGKIPLPPNALFLFHRIRRGIVGF